MKLNNIEQLDEPLKAELRLLLAKLGGLLEIIDEELKKPDYSIS